MPWSQPAQTEGSGPVSISDDDLRAALRNYAETAGPAGFPAETVIRRARRRRARFAAAAAGCTLAVAVVAVAAGALAGVRGGPGQYVPPIPVGPAGNGVWPAPFGCGQPLPAALPGAAGFALRISLGPITRSASGKPEVTWYMDGTEGPHHVGPEPGLTKTLVLVVRDDGTIVAVLPGSGPSRSPTTIPLVKHVVTESDMDRGEPRFAPCRSLAWSQMWAHHQRYGVVVLMTAWDGYPGADPARYGAAAALPSG
jgi:hypothetical protein